MKLVPLISSKPVSMSLSVLVNGNPLKKKILSRSRWIERNDPPRFIACITVRRGKGESEL